METTKSNYIEHTALVRSVEQGDATVTLVDAAGCSSCAIKNACGFSAGDHAKEFRIPLQETSVQPGDEVVVRIRQEAAFSAVMLSYFAPLVLVTLTLIVLVQFEFPEGAAGLFALLILLPYYLILFFKRKSLQKKLCIELMKR